MLCGISICPGRYFALNTLSIFIPSILHAFTIDAGVDASGTPIQLCDELVGGFIVYVDVFTGVYASRLSDNSVYYSTPRDFPQSFKPRSEAAANLVREAAVELGA